MIFISRPVAILLLVVYSLQLFALATLVWLYIDQKAAVKEQKAKIEELENRLKILDIIEDYEIGFSDDEVTILANVIYDESVKLGMDPLLIMAVIITESSFKKHQKSHVGAEGLMQIKPSIAKSVAKKWGIEWSESDGLWDPGLNITVGSAYLFELIVKFQDVRKAIIAYNLGETVTREYYYLGALPPPRYFDKVKENYLMLRRKFENKG